MDAINQMITMLVGVLTEGLGFCTDIIGIVAWVLHSLALFTIARRRGIPNPWLAWIPIGDFWILGVISDGYREKLRGEQKFKRYTFMKLHIALGVLFVLLLGVIFFGLLFGALSMEPTGNVLPGIVGEIAVLAVVAITIAMAVVAVWRTVLFYMALYDLFCSCDPDHSTLYLVLSLVGTLVLPGCYCIFSMICKNKDLGMPQISEA